MKPKNKRVGVYVCHCGTNIAGTVDVDAVVDYIKDIPNVVVAKNYKYMCSDPGQGMIQEDIKEHSLDAVVIASCSPRMHEPAFRKNVASAGLNAYHLDIANIREQCSWVHKGEEATEKAKTLVRSAVAKAKLLESLEGEVMDVTPSALVIGGGIAGIEAALDIAESGFDVHLIEKSDKLGGNATKLYKTYTHMGEISSILKPRIEALKKNKRIKLYLNSELEGIEGYVGNFNVKINQNGDYHDVDIGAIIVATGFDVFDPKLKPELGYGKYEEVVTSMELEEKLAKDDLKVKGEDPKNIFFLQCVGSRDHSVGNEYCSRVCCANTAKQAMQMKKKFPKANISVCYMDVRAFGKGFEEFYEKAQKEGIIYRRGMISELIKKNDKLMIKAEDTLADEIYEQETDLVVLAVGMTQRNDVEKLKNLLRIQTSADGFYAEAHPKLRPVDSSSDGIYLAGSCQAPKDIADTVAQAHGAASRACNYLFQGSVTTDPVISEVDKEACNGCGLCVDICEYKAIDLKKENRFKQAKSYVNPAMCKGCGACGATCPSGAISLKNLSTDHVIAQIENILSYKKKK